MAPDRRGRGAGASARARGLTSRRCGRRFRRFLLPGLRLLQRRDPLLISQGLTIALFAASAVLLASFVLVERRTTHPLVPLRIVTDRSRQRYHLHRHRRVRALFSVFLFMTYYMQQILHFFPVKTGLGFLPLTGAVIIVAPLVRRTVRAPRPAAGDHVRHDPGRHRDDHLHPADTQQHVAHVLPGLILAGAGTACVVSASLATGTLGVRHTNAGIAAALINTSQQIGGWIGTALLSAIFASSLAGYLASHPGAAHPTAVATVHAYAVGLAAGAVVFGIGLLLRPGPAPLAARHPSPDGSRRRIQ